MIPSVVSEQGVSRSHLRRYLWLLLSFWTVAVGVSFVWNIYCINRETAEMALSTANIAVEKDILYRSWAAGHGGVYVPVTDRTPPNPYLAHLEERDITTPSGRKLTLLNPAYMTRQVFELGKDQFGTRGHLTSLNPLRPKNAPDAWEADALNSFEGDTKAVSSIETMDGQSYMRLMRPLYTEQGCLKCHAQQGYELGDVRGGISVSIPLAPMTAIASTRMAALCIGHIGLWVLGLVGIAVGMRRVRVYLFQRDQAEESLRKTKTELMGHRDHLDGLVKQRTADLAKINDSLVREIEERRQAEEAAAAASSAKGDFLATMSHELRTPLNGIIGMTELLLGSGLTREQKKQAGLVKASGDILLRLINDILDFSKIEAGKLELEVTEFDIRDCVECVATLLGPQAEQKGLELSVNVNPALPISVRGDSGRLQQILTNLISNAIKFTEHGQIVIRAVVDDETESSVSVRVSVTDTGIGIPADKQQFLFQSFSQLDASHSRRFGGTGLGLAISKQLVEMMGGEIGAISESERGSTFWFSVTLEKGTHAGTAPQVPGDFRDMRILAVDDNETNREILDEQLAGFGISHELASSATEALAALRRAAGTPHAFAMAILDMQMPEMDAIQLAQEIKSDPDIADTVLLLLTSAGITGDEARMKAQGFSAWLAKPARWSQLLGAITQALACAQVDAPHELKEVAEPSRLPNRPIRVGAKILAAEDNEIGQEVIRQVLSQVGYTFEIVSNGRQAVDAWQRDQFDLILMDCQMPEMDGFEATRVIRRVEKENAVDPSVLPRIPIIALTANALKGDREKCLDAGMDNHVAKPFNPNQLIEAIESQLTEAENRTMTIKDSEANSQHHNNLQPDHPLGGCGDGAESTSPPFEMDAVLKRWGGDREFVQKLIDKFCSNAPSELDQLIQLVADGNVAEATRAAHGLKGAAAYCGAEAFRTFAAQLEEMGRAGDLNEADACLDGLKFELDRCLGHTQATAG